MTTQDTEESKHDILPRDQLEHYKVELSRIRAENDRLMSEVSYLRQALAAALSKVPQIDGPSSPLVPSSETSEAEESPQKEKGFWPWESSPPPVRYASLAPLLVSPLVLLALVMIALVCSIISFGFYIAFGV